MKQLLLSLFVAGMAILASAQANQHLSNLDSFTAVNLHLLPNADNKKDLGSIPKSWRNLYLDGALYLGGIPMAKAREDANLTFYGWEAGDLNTTGIANSAFGYRTLKLTTTGNYNSAFGCQALYGNASGASSNNAFGYAALVANAGQKNNAFGAAALYKNKAGSDNCSFGTHSLYLNDNGNANAAFGNFSLYNNLSGNYNIAVGFASLYNSRNNNHNVAIGDSALYNYNDGTYEDYMVAIGYNAMMKNTTGYYNTASGGLSLLKNTEGSSNTANGVSTLEANTTGSCNTAVGYRALDANITGSNNTAIGCYADVSSAVLTNATAVGHGAVATASNQVMLGNSSVISVKAAASFVTMSDGRFKNNRKENVPGLAFIKELKPVTYNYDIRKLNNHIRGGENRAKFTGRSEDCCNAEKEVAIANKEKKLYTGFIAQEVEVAANNLGYDFSGVYKPENDKDAYGLSYSDFVVPLVKAVQELSAQNGDLQKQITELRTLINVSTQSSTSSVPPINAMITGASLDGNAPNPFTASTSINYTLPQKFTNAQIVITDKSGNVLKQVDLFKPGKGTLQVDASTLSSGAYYYSLYVEGRLITTKQMILTK